MIIKQPTVYLFGYSLLLDPTPKTRVQQPSRCAWDLNRHSSLSKVPARRNGDRDISLSVRSYLQTRFPRHPAISAREVDEAAGALGCGGCLLAWEQAEGSEEHCGPPVASPYCWACPLAWPPGWAPFAVAPCVCSCLVVIRSSHRTAAPSHLQGGSAAHIMSFSASATPVPELEFTLSACVKFKLLKSKTLSKTVWACLKPF